MTTTRQRLPVRNRKCNHCGEGYVPARSRSKFCSKRCSSEAQKAGREFTCEECGIKFYRRPGLVKAGVTKYCSRQCAGKAKRGRGRQNVAITCQQCGGNFLVYPHEVNYRKFCSRKCDHAFKRHAETKQVICLVCSKPFSACQSRQASGAVECCSMKCRRALNITRDESREHKTIKCKRCGKPYVFAPSKNRSGSHRTYCSEACKNGDTIIALCRECGKSIAVQESQKQFKAFCSNQCKNKFTRGSNTHSWKGGRLHCQDTGYVLVTSSPGDDRYVGYQAEHREVAEAYIGRQLERYGEPVIHLNGANNDNRPENLYVFPSMSLFLRARSGGDDWPIKSNLAQLRQEVIIASRT